MCDCGGAHAIGLHAGSATQQQPLAASRVAPRLARTGAAQPHQRHATQRVLRLGPREEGSLWSQARWGCRATHGTCSALPSLSAPLGPRAHSHHALHGARQRKLTWKLRISRHCSSQDLSCLGAFLGWAPAFGLRLLLAAGSGEASGLASALVVLEWNKNCANERERKHNICVERTFPKILPADLLYPQQGTFRVPGTDR